MSFKSWFNKAFYNDVVVEIPDTPVSYTPMPSVRLTPSNIMDETIIISCYFNPLNSPYRLKAFNKFYDCIKQYNHKIVECVIGNKPAQLSDDFEKVHTSSLLWHKETLLNNIIKSLPTKYKYIFWIDADIIFTNPTWLEEGAKVMAAGANIVQPFEYCVHLEKDRLTPDFNVNAYKKSCTNPMTRHKSLWRSFCSNYASGLYANKNYDAHGHVGFAWGIKREIFDKIPGGLYDKALIGGADHIMAHAAAGQINHSCIVNSFTDDIDNINAYSKTFYAAVNGKIGYVLGDIYHIWHGELKDRQYLKRIKEFTPLANQITERDDNGLYMQDDDDDTSYMLQYFLLREVLDDGTDQSGFIEDDPNYDPAYIDNSQPDSNWIDNSAPNNQGNSSVSPDTNNDGVRQDNTGYNFNVQDIAEVRQDNNSGYNIQDVGQNEVHQDNNSYNIQGNNSYQGSTFS